MREFTEQEQVRRDKALKLREMGMDPFGQKFDRDSFAQDIHDKFAAIDHDEFENRNDIVTIAGRIMFIRKMGKASFFSIQDKTGKMQIYISINDVGEDTYTLFKSADLGDIVGVTGKVMKTRTGEVTVKCLKYTHLVKALRPLPEKFHGLTDKEERYRRRYVDLIMNDDTRRVAFLRPKIIRCIQNFMDNRGFVEVETPVLTTLLTGASARPFTTHHNAQDLDMYLRIALELPLKRLLVGGMEAGFGEVIIVGRHSQLHRLWFTQRGTEHEECNQKHHHIHHRRKVYADTHFLLFALLFLSHTLFLRFFIRCKQLITVFVHVL